MNALRPYCRVVVACVALACLCQARSAAAQGTLFQWSVSSSPTGGPDLSEPIITDRPDFTEASVTVGRGVFQIEAGYTYFDNSHGGNHTTLHSWGEPLIRYGIFRDWLEFRFAVFPTHQQDTTGGVTTTTSGVEALYTGVKLGLTGQDGILPEMALVPQVVIPLGSAATSVEPGMNWLYGWDINDWLATGGSTQGNQRVDDTGDTYLEVAQSWTINYALADRWGAYTEWFALFPSGAQTASPEHYFDGGTTFLVTDNAQLDLRAGIGLNEPAADYFAGIGLSLRFLPPDAATRPATGRPAVLR